ncbi:MAG: RecQ family ATP-dependent DNA helicase [Flavobacteriaceae bacterium]|nr:RecQ family ATP-dependent DNA helicase [Flavobacteriaceae bacterium]
MHHPVQILEHYWNYTAFRPLQEDIIEATINGEDVFALMPTGGGKSLCFQIPALAKEGICIVISPLIALMKDQVKSLKNIGVKAMALTSEYHYNDMSIMLDNCIYGKYKFLYLSPERLQQELVQNRIRQMNVNLIAVDEAHCISQWGNDFRPAYNTIVHLRELHPSVNVIALSASAKNDVVDDIVKKLDFIKPKIFRQSFERNNLAYMVFDTEDKHYKIEQILNKNPQSSIIYTRNRRATLELNNYLEQKGFSSTYYHGGLNPKIKTLNLSAWKNNQKQVMVATNAFGMGIDKADVKTVIHINIPESVESYFQEAGRAGRNGNKAFSIILKNSADNAQVKKQFLSVLPTIDYLKLVYRKLCSYFQIPYGEGEFNTFQFNFNDFCKSYKLNTLLTYNVLQALDRTSIISLSKQFQNRTEIKVLVTNNQLFGYIRKHPEVVIVVKSMLRTYGGIFDYETKVNLKIIANKSDVTEEKVVFILQKLEKDAIISLKSKSTDAQITFLAPREDDKTIHRIAREIAQQNDLKKKQVHAMLSYMKNDDVCKSIQLLSYFGETNPKTCGICSVCVKDKIEETTIENQIKKIKQILKNETLSSREIAKHTTLNEQHLICVLQRMLEHDIIDITAHNTYKLK